MSKHLHYIDVDNAHSDLEALFSLPFYGTWADCKRLAASINAATGYPCNLWQKRSFYYVMLGTVWHDGHYVGV